MKSDFICVACQTAIDPATSLVQLDGGEPLPVCRPCWDKIPIASRVALADRMRSTRNAEDVQNSLRRMADSIDRLANRQFMDDDDNPIGWAADYEQVPWDEPDPDDDDGWMDRLR